MQDKALAARLADRADDVRREAKSIQRRMRVLIQLAAEMELDAAELRDEADRDVAQRPVE